MIRYHFLRDNKVQPIGCICTDIIRHKDGLEIDYGISVLNPKDKFDRALARNIAKGRLLTNPRRYFMACHGKPSAHVILQAVMQDLWNDTRVPTRARKAAKSWVIDHDSYHSLPNQGDTL